MQPGRRPPAAARTRPAVEALRLATAIQEAAGDLEGRRFTLTNLGDLHHEAGDSAAAAGSYRAALDISRDLGDRWQVARILDRLAETLAVAGDTEAADAYAREAHAMFTDLRARPMAREYLRRAAGESTEDSPATTTFSNHRTSRSGPSS